jgi:hypothetical protein
MHVVRGICPEKFFDPKFNLFMPGKIFSHLFLNVRKPTSPQIFFDLPRSPTFLRERGKKFFFAAGHHRLSQGNSSRHPPRAIPFNVHTPLWTRSIKFEPLRKKDQSADTNTPPPEINKFLSYPSEKMQRSKDADAHNLSEKAFSSPLGNSCP